MSHYLFPIDKSQTAGFDAKYRFTEIPQQLFHIIRAATDAVEALELFLKLLFEPAFLSLYEAPTLSGYLSFDAEVGDAASQLRSCMLLELTRHLRRSGSCASVVAIRSTIQKLKETVKNAHVLLTKLLKLERNKGRYVAFLDELDIAKFGLSIDDLLVKLGWADSHNVSLSYDNRNASSQESLASQGSFISIASSQSSLGSGTHFAPIWNLYEVDDPVRLHERNWDLSNWKDGVRFIVYSYVLSKYKQPAKKNGVYRGTLNLGHAFEFGQELTQEDFGRYFVCPNTKAIGKEFLSLQQSLSNSSCMWLESKAHRSWNTHSHLHSLLKSTIQVSKSGVVSTSSYVSYLVLRGLWVEEHTPIMITTRRVCSKGFHINYFSVTPYMSRHEDEVNHGSAVCPRITWQVKRLAGKELLRLQRCLEPHIIISGNSINRDVPDCLSQLRAVDLHDDGQCSDNEHHCNSMLSTDQELVVQAMFAKRRHYAFELCGEEGRLGENLTVQRLIDEFVPGLSAKWEASRQGATKMEMGLGMMPFEWQHVALESPARFLLPIGNLDISWFNSITSQRTE